MNPIVVILTAKRRMAFHGIAAVREESRLKVGVISISALLIWFLVLATFMEGFHWMLKFGLDRTSAGPAIGTVILARMLGVLMLATLVMLVFSNILVSFSTLFRSQEVSYLLQTPITIRAFFMARFIECVLFSSWALAYLGSPLILAFGITNHAPWTFYAAAILLFLPFVTLPAATGAIITLILARVFPRFRAKTLILLGILAITLFFYYWKTHFSASHLSRDTLLPALLDMTTQTQSPLLPSTWMTRGLFAAIQGNLNECFFNLLLLLSNALMLVWVAAELAQRMFYPAWSALVGKDDRNTSQHGPGVLGHLDRFFCFLPNPSRALVLKDIKLFWRDPAQWSQFVIFFGIMAIYIANLRNAGVEYREGFWKSWIACINTGACTLILATLTTRFVFPLISLEGRRFWILGLAPLSFNRLVWQKFWLSVITTSLFTLTLAVLSAIMLQLEPLFFFLTVYNVIITNFALSGLAVGLGALYPNFQEDNPARIVSGMGGTLNFLLSIGYIAWITAAQTLIIQWRTMGMYHSNTTYYSTLGIVLLFVTSFSVLCTLVPLRMGFRNLKTMEF